MPFAFHFSQGIIDTVLKYGGNERDGRMRIVAEFMKEKSVEEHAAFLQRLFHGGNGFKIDNRDICAWYDDDGIRLAHGRSARYISSGAVQIIPWTDAAVRIDELLLQGQFASNVEIAEAAGHERLLLSDKLLYLRRDIRDDVHDSYFSDVTFEGGFPEARERSAEMLADPLMLQTITEELERFADDYREDRTLLRFNYHRVDDLLISFCELAIMNRTFSSEITDMPKSEQFITEDELNEAFSSHGSGVEGCKSRIYNYFMTERDTKERIAFLKKEYGIGGHSHALSNAGGSDEMHDGKGIAYKKDDCANVQISWPNVEKRISELIRRDRYLNPSEKAAYAALRSVGEVYNAIKEEHPDDIVLYQVGDFFEIYGEDAKLAAEKLDLYKSTRNLPGIGRVDMCGFPANRLEERAEKLREEYPITIIAYDKDTHERNVYSMAVSRVSNEPIEYTTPEGNIYHVGSIFSGMLNGSVTYAYIEDVDDDSVHYTLEDYPELGPVSMSREQFDANLDDYTFQIKEEENENIYSEEERDPGFIKAIGDAIILDRSLSEDHIEIDHVNALLSAMKMDDVSVSWENDTIVARDDNNIWRGQELYEFLLNEALTLDEHFHPVQGQDVPQEILDAVLEDAKKYDTVIQTVRQRESSIPAFPYEVGDFIYLEDGNEYIVESIGENDIHLRDPRQAYPILRAESKESMARLLEQFPQKKREPIVIVPPPENFRITDDHLGEGGAKTKFRRNMDAINTLKAIEAENRYATPEEQEILSQYIGWGGLADAFDDSKEHWQKEFLELYDTLEPKEWTDAKSSTLNAHYTSPVVIRAMYEVLANMGFTSGNILEPAMGIGNFFGMLPSEMSGSKLYGVELDSLSGRIAKQLYPDADITIAGFETTDRRDFYDVAIGNVPFGNYKVNDKAYNKLNFSIHDYFLAKAIDQVRPGGVIAFVTSRYTMDKESPEVRKYIAERADLLGAIRLPNTAFKANAGTDVVTDILFLQKRERPQVIEPDWVHLGTNAEGYAINSYFIDHPDMILGTESSESTQYGRQDFTVVPFENRDLGELLHEAAQKIHGTYMEAELPDIDDVTDQSIPADPNVKNFSYTLVGDTVYYRENSRMVKANLNAVATERVKGMIGLRDCVRNLIDLQMERGTTDAMISAEQLRLRELYAEFSEKHGLINESANRRAFADDSSYYLLCSLEILDRDGNLQSLSDMFEKRTIRPHEVVKSVDTAADALALSISEQACVDMEYMTSVSGKDEKTLAEELAGAIFFDPVHKEWEPADEYLSGNVREKLRIARSYAAPGFPKEGIADYSQNVAALEAVQPKDLDASEIEVRLGATWIDKDYIQQFMEETFHMPFYLRRSVNVNFSDVTAEWNITGKSSAAKNDVNIYITYGTDDANAFRLLEDALNLRDTKIYDTVTDANGNDKRVLNVKKTTLAQQKQQMIKDAFRDWIWKDADRRDVLVTLYNQRFNSTRPREYDGSHITFSGMNPEISLREHQKNAVAHILYGGNTLLAHEVGAGKTFEMVAAAMESKRLGLCTKSLFVVPNHLTEQWASEFLRLYPSANILVTTKRDFETSRRKKFCARIATGDYDAVIMGHSQFEKIPISYERQERLLQEQLDEIEMGLEELQRAKAERFTVKSMERTKKSLEAKLEKLQDTGRKDDVITFEELGVDRLFVDEAHFYKNMFIFTKMQNVAGLSTTDAQKSSDMYLKCRYLDEITENKGIVFATGTPVSNSMTELYTMMRYLQHDALEERHLSHFDCWASNFGETVTAIELAPEGTGYRARTRFARFFNLPELMNLFREAADIKTADQMNLPRPEAQYHNIVAKPTDIQREMVEELSKRAARVHAGVVDSSVDNMLRITTDGRKLGLDQRIINPNLPDEPESKVNLCIDNIFRIWQEGMADKLTQIVFCDLSTPSKTVRMEVNGDGDVAEPCGFVNIYEDIREKLVLRGVPFEEVAIIHEADTEVKKAALFAKVRNGDVRVIIGSTSKMGAGTNIQDRLIALHDLDAPWRPGDLQQRAGRIIRQGNMNKEVHIYRYVTEGTFDSYLWQTIENKQRFISQIMTSKSPVRSCEDMDETALSYAEIKALCAGNPLIKEKMDLDIEVSKLKLLRANYQSQQYQLEDNIRRHFPQQMAKFQTVLDGYDADIQLAENHPYPADEFPTMVIGQTRYLERDAAGEAIMRYCSYVSGLEPVVIGEYRGFTMSLTLEDFGRDYILTLRGTLAHRVELGRDARGNTIRIENAIRAMPDRRKEIQVAYDNLQVQMEQAQEELGKPFPQEGEYQAKTARLVELNAVLNMENKHDSDLEEEQEDTPVTSKNKDFEEVL
ncbi:MAG: DEAD/DEAH box helicase family protein [Clostridia bacterium]|nr:DEAD/DEAH box helicase family protein [Clostridia bacterium]